MDIAPIARAYRWIEYAAFGPALERSRFLYLDHLHNARRVLVLGEGDGRMMERMLVAAPDATFDIVELSAAMIARARERVGESSRVRFICGDAREFDITPGYDAVVACFFFDCLGEGDARKLIHRIAGAMNHGVWLISEFAVPDAGWRRCHARMWIDTMYAFFRTSTGLQVRALPPLDKLFAECGLQRTAKTSARWGLIVSEVWQSPGQAT